MLITKIAQAKVLISTVQIEEKKALEHKQYVKFLAELENQLPLLNGYTDTLEVLQKNRPGEFRNQDVTGILTKIKAILTILQSDELPKKADINGLVKEVSNLESELRKDWKKYVRKTTQDSLGVLDNVKGILTDTEKIDDVINKLKSLEQKWPVTKKTLQDLTDSLKEAQQIIQDLNAGEEVQKFLGLVSTGTATLYDIKPEILDWLKLKKLTKNLKINFAKRGM